MNQYQDQDSVDLVQGELFTGTNVTVLATWVGARVLEEIDPETADRYPAMNVSTPRGVKRASIGDYLIKRPDQTVDVFTPIAFRARFKKLD